MSLPSTNDQEQNSSRKRQCPPEDDEEDNTSAGSSVRPVTKKVATDLEIKGTIKLVISNLSQLERKATSSLHNIAGLPWRLDATIAECRWTENVEALSFYIYCNPGSESSLWYCEASAQFKLLNQNDPTAHLVKQLRQFQFNCDNSNRGFSRFIAWKDIIKPEKGYIKDDQVTIEAHIVVHKTSGVRSRPMFDFTQPQCSDCVLVIGGVRLHVSKAYLSLHSPVFSALFFGEFRERAMDEVPLEDVILEEFTELLNVIYPSHKAITADNVEYLLKLGDKFDIGYVMDGCERYLMQTDEMSVATKLGWADQYQLIQLLDHCIRSFETAEEIKDLKTTDEYKKLSRTTKSELLEKIFKLM